MKLSNYNKNYEYPKWIKTAKKITVWTTRLQLKWLLYKFIENNKYFKEDFLYEF